MSTTSKGREFEDIVQGIYTMILNAEGYKNLDLQKRVTLTGKSGARAEFDIFWKFEMAGLVHQVAIECKNYNRPVDVGSVREFYGKLSDFNGIRGIMVTRIGYQDSAMDFARNYCISLKRFQFVDEMNWDGYIKDIIIECHIQLAPHVVVRPDLDISNLTLDERKILKQRFLMSKDIQIYDSHKKYITSFRNIIKSQTYYYDNKEHTHTHYFDEDAFICCDNVRPVRINSITFTFIPQETIETSVIKAEDYILGYLLDEENEDNSYLCFRNGNVRKNSSSSEKAR